MIEVTMVKKNSMSRKVFLWINVLLFIGMFVSLFLVYEHFAPGASKFCSFSEGFDCGIVNKSPYANLDGISYLITIDLKTNIPLIDISSRNPFLDLITSNAFLGFITLLFLLLLTRATYKSKDFLWIESKKGLKWLRGIITFGVIYGFYLFIIQHSILKTYCIFCLALDLVMVALLIIFWRTK